MNIGYVRVSTVEQNEDRQIEGLKKYDIEKWYTEKVSGKDMNRPKLQEMLDFVREGDTVFVHDFSRLARSTKDLLSIVQYLKDKGVHLVSNKENIDTNSNTGYMFLTILSAIYEFERRNMLERQREGIAVKKEQDKHLPHDQRTYKGRKEISIPDDVFIREYDRYCKREINKVQLAEILNVSRPTLDKLIKQHIQ